MSQQTKSSPNPDYNVIPVQLSEQEFEQFILPHLSLPKRFAAVQAWLPPRLQLHSQSALHWNAVERIAD